MSVGVDRLGRMVEVCRPCGPRTFKTYPGPKMRTRDDVEREEGTSWDGELGRRGASYTAAADRATRLAKTGSGKRGPGKKTRLPGDSR
jgi:hypothetical protein